MDELDHIYLCKLHWNVKDKCSKLVYTYPILGRSHWQCHSVKDRIIIRDIRYDDYHS